MSDKDKISTYSENAKLRGFVISACIICAFVLGFKHTSIFHSYYDDYMIREIFRDPSVWTLTDGADVGAFWKNIRSYTILSYVVSAIVIIFNLPYSKKNTLAGTISESIVYAFLALSIPIDFFVCMIGSRSYIIDIYSFTFAFEILAFVFFAGAFVVHIKSCFNTGGHFEKGKLAFLTPAICILLLAIPVSFLGRAIKLSADYSSNYGKFKVDTADYDPTVEDMFYNYYQNGVEYDGSLYICALRFGDSPFSVDRLDSEGYVSHVADIETSGGRRLNFDVYMDKIYYFAYTNTDHSYDYKIVSRDIDTGAEDVLYTDVIPIETGSWDPYNDFFKIKDGMLYYHIANDGDSSIYCFDLDNDPYIRELYVTDILRSSYEFGGLTYQFLYNYIYPIRNSYVDGGDIYRGDWQYYIISNGAEYEDSHYYVNTRLIRSMKDDHMNVVSEEVYSSDRADGICYYDNAFYFFDSAAGDICCYDLGSGELQTVAHVDGVDHSIHFPMYIYGDHILLVDDNGCYIVVER